MIAALLMRRSIFATWLIISALALRTDLSEPKSRWMNWNLTLGEVLAIRAITGAAFDSDRPARMRRAGDAFASGTAVSEPIPPSLDPVITTVCCEFQFLLKDKHTYLSFLVLYP
jgi:hypothetical protein